MADTMAARLANTIAVRYIPKDGDDEIWVEVEYATGISTMEQVREQADKLINEVRMKRGKPLIVFDNHQITEVYEAPMLILKRNDKKRPNPDI